MTYSATTQEGLQTKILIPTRQDVQKAIALEMEKLKAAHLQLQTIHTEGQVSEQLGASWYACAGCKVGLYTTLAAPVAAAIVAYGAGGGTAAALIAGIATACGLSEAAVVPIIIEAVKLGVTGVDFCIGKLCHVMKAC